MKKLIFATAIIASLSFSSQAFAQSMSGATGRVAGELGTKDGLDATTTCTLACMTGSAGGNIGLVNQMMCLMKAQSLTVTGTTGVTKVIDLGNNQTVTAHIVLNKPGPTIDGVDYTYELKVWTCGTGCTATTGFLPAVYTAFNTNAAFTVNNGVLINNFSADSGSIKGSSFVKWDTGGNTTVRTIKLAMVDCSNSPTGANFLKYTRTGDTLTLNELNSSASGVVTRSALTWSQNSDQGNWMQDSLVSAGGDSPAWGGGWTRTASGTDYTYSAASTFAQYSISAFPTEISGTAISGSNYQGITRSAITQSGVPLVTTGAGILTTPMTANGGMTTNPPNI